MSRKKSKNVNDRYQWHLFQNFWKHQISVRSCQKENCSKKKVAKHYSFWKSFKNITSSQKNLKNVNDLYQWHLFRNVWKHQIPVGSCQNENVSQKMTRFDQIWQSLTGTLTKLDKIWQDLTNFDETWQGLTRSDESLTRFDKIWQSLIRFDKKNDKSLTQFGKSMGLDKIGQRHRNWQDFTRVD